MNTVTLIGRLTKDPEIRSSETTTVGRITLAVDRRFKKEGGPTADFLDISVFGKTAENVSKYLKKGSKVAVQGRIENNNYTNRDGQKVYGLRITAENVEFLDSKASGEAHAMAPATATAPAPAIMDEDGPMTAEPEDDFFPDDEMPDLPFA